MNFSMNIEHEALLVGIVHADAGQPAWLAVQAPAQNVTIYITVKQALFLTARLAQRLNAKTWTNGDYADTELVEREDGEWMLKPPAESSPLTDESAPETEAKTSQSSASMPPSTTTDTSTDSTPGASTEPHSETRSTPLEPYLTSGAGPSTGSGSAASAAPPITTPDATDEPRRKCAAWRLCGNTSVPISRLSFRGFCPECETEATGGVA